MRVIAITICLVVLSMTAVTAAEQEQQIFRATVGDDGTQTVFVTGGSYFFSPNHIIVKVNVPVRFTIQKESGMVPHDIVINAPDAGINIDEEMKTKARTITFTPTKTGTYKIYCSKKLLFFKSHEDKGMEGILEVVESLSPQ